MSEMSGFEYSLWEIDEQLKGYVDHFKRRLSCPSLFTHIIEGQEFSVDQILDQRNEVVYLMGYTALEGIINE